MTTPRPEQDKLRIFYNTNITMSRGKLAAHAVHAALTAAGVHPGTPVVVLGAKPRDIEHMRTHIRDEGRTELEPGTLTAGTDFVFDRRGNDALSDWYERHADELSTGARSELQRILERADVE